MNEEELVYGADGLTMRGRLFFQSFSGTRGAVLVFPEAFGLDDRAIERARELAAIGYVALACDLHGEGRVIDDLQEAMSTLQPLFDNPGRTRARTLGALSALTARKEVDVTRVAAMGFCFPASIELARSGADIRAAIGFHTSLATKADKLVPGTIKARMMVCIGADDPFIPLSHRSDFENEMRDVGAVWEMQVYGGTVHSFTNPEAAKRNMPEAIRYNPDSAARAWGAAIDLLSQTIS